MQMRQVYLVKHGFCWWKMLAFIFLWLKRTEVQSADLIRASIFSLSHVMPLVSFYTPWKHQETKGFLIFSGCIERDEWHDMGLNMASMIFLHTSPSFSESRTYTNILTKVTSSMIIFMKRSFKWNSAN